MPAPLRFVSFFLLLFIISYRPVLAIYDPLSLPNNRIGVHVFDPGEVDDASKLVNSSSGDWGYLTVPIRIDDRDPVKWKDFFTTCRKLHLIPIIRLATFVDGDHWVQPTVYDLLDFANFLNDMPWPIQNRYVILFNEPNHSKEWGNQVSPLQYAALLTDAYQIFKSRSENFFLLSAGLDMSAPTNATSLDALEFYRQLTVLRPDWYSYIDGLSVHAYPNPGFSSSPYSSTRFGISSYRYETDYLRRLGFPAKPVFITETGSIYQSGFYLPALTQIWTDSQLVAITPFVLFAGSGDFTKFSLLDTSHQPTANYRELLALPKVHGSPLLDSSAPQAFVITSSPPPTMPSPGLSPTISALTRPSSSTFLMTLYRLAQKLFPGFFQSTRQLLIKDVPVQVEIRDTDSGRSKGLSGRAILTQNTGMLFIFPESDFYAFWMPDMRFPIDIIWVNAGKVVYIAENVPAPDPSTPKNLLPLYRPAAPANWVLEVPAGFAYNHGIQLGDQVMLK